MSTVPLLLRDRTDFPCVSIGLGITIQIVDITPETAAEWLTKRYDRQRRLKARHMDMIARDIVSDKWMLNGETIIFDTSDHLTNGQHRLTACIKAGEPIRSLVVRGIKTAAYDTIDGVAKRSRGDTLAAEGVENAIRVASALRTLYHYDRGLILSRQVELSNAEIVDLYLENPGIMESVRFGRSMPKVFNRGPVHAMHFVTSRHAPETAPAFWEPVKTGAGLEKNDPRLRLRNKMMDDNRLNDWDVVILISKAWNIWRAGKTSSLSLSTDGAVPDLV